VEVPQIQGGPSPMQISSEGNAMYLLDAPSLGYKVHT
jgi:hypothetical protein